MANERRYNPCGFLDLDSFTRSTCGLPTTHNEEGKHVMMGSEQSWNIPEEGLLGSNVFAIGIRAYLKGNQVKGYEWSRIGTRRMGKAGEHTTFNQSRRKSPPYGFGISAARLGLPDTGLISYGEMLDQGRLITEAVSIPVIGDGDNGYGNAMNVKRTVKGFIKAGFAGILLEDQVSPKACGHTQGRKVVSRDEAVMKIKAAVDARKESGSDIVIVARTDSRQALSIEEALWRSRAFAEAGADVLFVDALASKEEMKAFCEVATSVPKLANMLEGGGKTPILTPLELEDIGYKIVAYPLSLMGVSIRAMETCLPHKLIAFSSITLFFFIIGVKT
uniref:Phosphoenolpyruvate carboxylase family protein n=1 Tax=Tanacetum cinerariifolium TaxID=118510 RepID=A0A6L2NWL2_TANCI|nr:phosphoenolpyruvate carboxylase family protein [Tanacetum cinerariifolium]